MAYEPLKTEVEGQQEVDGCAGLGFWRCRQGGEHMKRDIAALIKLDAWSLARSGLALLLTFGLLVGWSVWCNPAEANWTMVAAPAAVLCLVACVSPAFYVVGQDHSDCLGITIAAVFCFVLSSKLGLAALVPPAFFIFILFTLPPRKAFAAARTVVELDPPAPHAVIDALLVAAVAIPFYLCVLLISAMLVALLSSIGYLAANYCGIPLVQQHKVLIAGVVAILAAALVLDSMICACHMDEEGEFEDDSDDEDEEEGLENDCESGLHEPLLHGATVRVG